MAYKDAPGFLGATAGTNNTAELSAPAWVIFWAMAHAKGAPVTICYDNFQVGGALEGTTQFQANAALAATVTMLARLYQAATGHAVVGSHVKAHTGHCWNELADWAAQSTDKALQPGVLDGCWLQALDLSSSSRPSATCHWQCLATPRPLKGMPSAAGHHRRRALIRQHSRPPSWGPRHRTSRSSSPSAWPP